MDNNIVVLGFNKGVSKKSGEPFCMLHVSVSYPESDIGLHGNNYRAGCFGQDLFIPSAFHNKVDESVIGLYVIPTYTPTSAGPRITGISFLNPETGEIVGG